MAIHSFLTAIAICTSMVLTEIFSISATSLYLSPQPGHVAEVQILPSQVTLDFILDERARELAGEQLRWFDLKRTNKLVERIKALNPDGAQFIQSFHVLRPIPQSQIDAVANKDEFTQNPGYQ